MPQHPYNFENNWYYVTGPESLKALRTHGEDITYLIPFWFGVTEEGGLDDNSDEETLTIIQSFRLPVLAIVHNYASREYGPLIHRLLTNNNLRRNLVRNILNMLHSYRFAGVNIDFEFIPPKDRQYMTQFMMELYKALKPYGYLVTISVPPELEDDPTHPFSGAFSYQDLAQNSDQIYVLAYDEHVAVPGPIASIDFVKRVLDYALSEIPKEKIRLGMAVYGRDWAPGEELPAELAYTQAIDQAVQYGAVIKYDEEVQEPIYTYIKNEEQHIVWYEDVQSFAAKFNLVIQKGILGIGVWRLGLEDPHIWDLLQEMDIVHLNSSNICKSNNIYYTVERGDSLWSIARRYGTTVKVVVRANNLVINKHLTVGQKLIIPLTANTGLNEYVVLPGDTLWKIAQIYKTSVSAIIRANNLYSTKYLKVGQKLFIPK